ncbi:AMP-binding protein [Fictibacillus gelatini]|uniref:AMP-binding protein n=1 Tax=Fictibacillus gelatini TaxID=225985 RepID=UPI0003FFBF2B|nr:AMP-binding protein [Fictibacillus gelatini]
MLISDMYLHAKPDHYAVVTDKKRITYAEWKKLVAKIEVALRSVHADKQERKIAILLHNSVEFLQLFVGAAQAGWIAVPFDYKWSSGEIQSNLKLAKPDILIVDHMLQKKLEKVPEPTQVIVLGGKADEFQKWLNNRETESKSYEDVPDTAPFYMGFTSGTTGTPKAFIRSHRSWVKSFDCSMKEFGISDKDHVLVPGPLVHSHFLYAVISTLFIGGTVYLLKKFSPASVFSFLSTYPITTMYMVPTMFEALIKHRPDGIATNTLTKILSSGAKWEKDSKRKMKMMFPSSDLYEFYGASELSFVTFSGPEDTRRKPDSVGRPFHNVTLSIQNNGREVGIGEIGKLYVQSEQLFMGYYENEEETNKVLQHGWATVGDMAKRDEDGYIYLVGREKNMMIYGGLNVYPEEIEKTILRLPEIEEAVVLGIDDNYWGEIITAVIVVKKGYTIDQRTIKAHCRTQLANYKVPRNIVFVDSIPYTTSGKAARAKLKEDLLKKELV